jgi:hypothetical protein
MQELARKKKWMFARSSFHPPLVFFEETTGEKVAWRNATQVLGAPNRPTPPDFTVTNKYRAGYHLSGEIPGVPFGVDQRLVFVKYYGPSFGLRYVGAMWVGALHELALAHKGISHVMKTRFNLPLPDNVDYFRVMSVDKVELVNMTPPLAPEEGKEAAPPCLPEHGEVIVLQASDTAEDFSFATKFSSFPRFAPPEPVIRTLSFAEQLLEDAEAGFAGVDVKFVGGKDDAKYCILAHRSALCTTQYFRRLFTSGVKESQLPPPADKEGFHLITPPEFADERTMRNFIRWIYVRRIPKEVQLDLALCLNLSNPLQISFILVRLGNYCVCDALVHDGVEIIGRLKTFDVETALDALDLANAIDESEGIILRRRAMQYVVAHFEEVAAAERFQKMVGTAVYYSIIGAVYQVVKATL